MNSLNICAILCAMCWLSFFFMFKFLFNCNFWNFFHISTFFQRFSFFFPIFIFLGRIRVFMFDLIILQVYIFLSFIIFYSLMYSKQKSIKIHFYWSYMVAMWILMCSRNELGLQNYPRRGNIHSWSSIFL